MAAAISLPLRYCFASPTVAISAVAVNGPTPRNCCKRLATGSCCAITPICLSSSAIRWSSTCRSPHNPWSSCLNKKLRPLSASSSQSGIARRNEDNCCGATNPYSDTRPLIWLPLAMRWLFISSRTRCIAWISCCSTVFTRTGCILGLPIASQIACASLASFLLLFTKGLTNCGGMIVTS